MQTRAHCQVAGAQQFAHLQIVKFVHHHVVARRVADMLAQIQRHHPIIFVVAVDTGAGGERQHLVTARQHPVHHLSEGFFIFGLRRAQTFIKRRQFAQGDGDGFLLPRHVQPVLHRIAGGKILILMIDQPGGINPLLHFAGVDLAALHQVQAHRLAQDQRIAVTKHVVRQLVELRILERPYAMADHKQRFFGHKGTERMLELWHAVQIDKE